METDNKYDDCLRDPNQQVSLGTIFHLAKKAGLAFSYGESGGMVLRTEHSRGEDCQSGKVGNSDNSDNSDNSFATPVGSLANPDTLSEFIQSILLADTDSAIQDLLLFGSLVSLSSVMPHVSGIYGGKRVYPNLYGFVASSLRITKCTADRWLGQLVSKYHLLTRLKPGHYQKVKPAEE